MLDGTGKQLLEPLKRLDDTAATYESLVANARQEVANAQVALDSLLALEGLCEATTLKTPTGRKRRRDRGKKRLTAKQEQQLDEEIKAALAGKRPATAENFHKGRIGWTFTKHVMCGLFARSDTRRTPERRGK